MIHAKPWEWLVFGIALWGVMRSSSNLQAAIGDLQRLRRSHQHTDRRMRIVAKGYVRAEATRLIAQTLAFVGGTALVLTEPNDRVRFIIRAILIAFIVLLNVQSELAARTRRKVIEYELGGNTGKEQK